MPEELCQVSPKSHCEVLAQHSDPSPFAKGVVYCKDFGNAQRAITAAYTEITIGGTFLKLFWLSIDQLTKIKADNFD